jgi:hypothetical protein
MTETSVGADQADVAFVPSGRPVARFVTVLAVTAVLLTALSWSGLMAPHAHVEMTFRRYVGMTRSGVSVLLVRNQGPMRAELAEVASGDPYVRITRTTPATPQRINAGDVVRINVEYSVDCARFARDRSTSHGATEPNVAARVRVQGAVGRGRWINASGGPSGGLCSGGFNLPQPSLPPTPASG